MKVLFVAFEFPPLGGGGVQRSMKFAKYLPQSGITPVIVTTDADSFRRVMDQPMDPKLLDDLPANLEIERVPCRRTGAPSNGKFAQWRPIFFSIVEEQAKLWRPELERALPQILQRHKPAAIYVSLPPFGMAPLWCGFAQRFDLPLVLDFRDAWSQWRIGPYGSWLHYLLTLQLEKRCLAAADHVVCTSNQTRQDFLRVHPDIARDKISVITNGYDREIGDWKLEPRRHGQTFTIGYVGSFYYSPQARDAMMKPWWRKRPNRMIQYAPRKEDWRYRSPYFFFRTLAYLLAAHPDLKTKLRVRFAGQKPQWIDAQVSEFGLKRLVEFTGYLDHPSVLAFQNECDCLLVTSSKVIGGQDYSIAGKTFEYFSLKKPVLGFVAEGAQKEMLLASGMAVVCDPDNPEESAARMHQLFTGRARLAPNAEFLRRLHRRELTQRLADIIRQAVPSQLISSPELVNTGPTSGSPPEICLSQHQ